MKRLFRVMLVVLLAVLIAAQLPMQVLAEGTSPKYISEIKIGVGKKASDALAALDGYEILKDGSGSYVDLNKNAGGGWGSKGDRVVYLGFKRTSLKSEAITDLAVMNMKGAYKTDDYDALMEDYITEQINPFVENFISTIREYRENYSSSNASNRARAQYIHDALNKFTDDDCGDAGLGDLLLNETKYEMGDAAYNALSEEEKNQHADIVTIIAQANGIATLALESLLTRAADTEDTTWTERLSVLTYDDLADETGLSPSKAKAELSKQYYDDAMKILDMWDAFREELEGYDEASAKLDELQNKDLSAQIAIIENFDPSTASEAEQEAYGKALAEIKVHSDELASILSDVMCKEYLESIEYDDGTLLDLFLTPAEDFYEGDISDIYPVVASLSDGQRAGLDFITLQDLVLLGGTDENGYKDATYDEMENVSVYENVDRGIYEKGGVGLTSDAIRLKTELLATKEDNPYLSSLSYAMIGITSASVVAFGVTLGMTIHASRQVSAVTETIATLQSELNLTQSQFKMLGETANKLLNDGFTESAEKMTVAMKNMGTSAMETEFEISSNEALLTKLSAKSSLCNKLTVGIGVAMVILVAVTTYLTYRDLVNHYKVEFTPIPRYMVDEKDITAYNSNGDKIVIKNQSAYYKAALCNRKDGDDYYSVVGDVGDLNGDVGQQWLALYAERNENNDPILADSFKISTSEQIPAGYENGIHMFGTSAAENLNNPLYVWNSSAPKVYVYFKLDVGASTAGSSFSRGAVALTGVGGLATGALATALIMTFARKKKEEALLSGKA